MQDTIVALTTPFGRSGIAVIRLSGVDVLKIARILTNDENFNPKPRVVSLKKIYEPDTKEILDEAVITYFQSPQSFTGEDVIEISCHGSPIVIRQIIDLCLKLDARLAEPGEFSLRALSNGRMDLSQAEAIRDLIDAQTVASAKQSVRQLRGEVSNQLQPIKDELLDVIVILESSIEFVEDDLPDFQIDKIKERLTNISSRLEKFASTFKAGNLLREGLKVALVGRPNVGKSSLFNALIGDERAIVTEIAGTTRDQLHEKISIKGVPVSLIDTAGVRETIDTVEIIGVERAKRVMADADLVIALLDGSESLTNEDEKILSLIKELNSIIAVNKSDLNQTNLKLNGTSEFIHISAKTGEGLDLLCEKILSPFTTHDLENSGFLVSDVRHHDLLLRSISEINESCKYLDDRLSEEIILVGLHNSMRYLGEITGETTTEDMLTRIFSTFCIGK